MMKRGTMFATHFFSRIIFGAAGSLSLFREGASPASKLIPGNLHYLWKDVRMIIEALKAFLFGIVEGITEWLPISSTGHMMLLEEFVKLDVSESFYSTFLVVIQLGAILAVILLFFNKLNPFARTKTPDQKKETWGIWAKVVVGSIPPAIIGFVLDDWMEEKIMNGPFGYVVVACALVIYGVIFIAIERRNRRLIAQANAGGKRDAQPAYVARHAKNSIAAAHANEGRTPAFDASTRRSENKAGESTFKTETDETDASSVIAKVNSFSELSYGKAFLIGIFESLAIIPGTSRSGSTIIGSMLLGTSRTIATEFAFFLAIPIMFGWSLIKFIKHGFAYTGMEWMIFGIAIVTSFVVSVLSIKFLVGYVKKNDFTAFGIYRIVLGIIVLGYFGLRAIGIF